MPGGPVANLVRQQLTASTWLWGLYVRTMVLDDAGGPDDAAGLRAANARLRELLAERDARIAEQRAEISVTRRSRAAGWPRLPTWDRRPRTGAGWLLAADRWA